VFNRDLIKQDFSRAAARYNDYAYLQREVASSIAKMAAIYIHEKAQEKLKIQLLDVGSGTGFVMQEISDKIGEDINQLDAVQLDISLKMCQQVHRYGAAVVGDMAILPVASNGCDVVTSSLALQWADKPEAVLKEMVRVLKPGGVLLCATLGPCSLFELRDILTHIVGSAHGSYYPDVEDLMVAFSEDEVDIIDIIGEDKIIYYNSLKGLFKSIRSIGASNKMMDRKQVLTRGKLLRMEQDYGQRYGVLGGVSENGKNTTIIGDDGLLQKNSDLSADKEKSKVVLPLTWEILYLAVVKPCRK